MVTPTRWRLGLQLTRVPNLWWWAPPSFNNVYGSATCQSQWEAEQLRCRASRPAFGRCLPRRSRLSLSLRSLSASNAFIPTCPVSHLLTSTCRVSRLLIQAYNTCSKADLTSMWWRRRDVDLAGGRADLAGGRADAALPASGHVCGRREKAMAGTRC